MNGSCCTRWSFDYFLCLHGAQDNGTRFLFLTTLNWGSGGECPALEEVVEGGVGGIVAELAARTSIAAAKRRRSRT
jgi:hypothetical protein